jgi:hypothetical protein
MADEWGALAYLVRFSQPVQFPVRCCVIRCDAGPVRRYGCKSELGGEVGFVCSICAIRCGSIAGFLRCSLAGSGARAATSK